MNGLQGNGKDRCMQPKRIIRNHEASLIMKHWKEYEKVRVHDNRLQLKQEEDEK
jgi:hypothetical protein